MIAEMQKLNLVAMSYDKDEILNALHRTRAVEVVSHKEIGYAKTPVVDTEALSDRLFRVEAALSILIKEVEERDKAEGNKSELLKDGFAVTYDEFMAAEGLGERVDETVKTINALYDEKISLKNELTKLKRGAASKKIYACLHRPFSEYSSTAKTKARLGVLPCSVKDTVLLALDEKELCAYSVLNDDCESFLLFTVTHKSEASETDGILSAYGFTESSFSGEETGAQAYEKQLQEIEKTEARIKENGRTVYEMKEEIRVLKTYCDYLSFTIEKLLAGEKTKETDKTFFLQAFVPKERTELVEREVLSVTKAAYLYFEEPSPEDEPPTLLQNNKLVDNFEPITNTYSVPNYREFDPNAVMAFFYSLFMGFIIGDMGYGLLMAVVGGYLWWKNRAAPTGMSRLAGAFACGGVFSVVWGALFNSFFGFAIFGKENTVMPDPQTGRCSFMGIQVPSVLVIALEVGIVQLFAGYLCKAVQHFRRGAFWDGVFEGIVWAIFSVGVAVAIVGLIDELNIPILAKVGGLLAGVSLLIAVLTAGRHEKAFGKFTKGFGAAYGVINYASDILSYARLYGLMLSGAVIAQIITNYGGGFIVSGNIPLAILGVLLLIVGHGFNLVMNLLGAYIHDARLQYVEFYGRFYEGDGELFKPLGSSGKYVKLLPAMAKQTGKSA